MLDISILGMFLILSLALGLTSSAKAYKDFIDIPTKMRNSVILFATIFATEIGSGSTIGLAEKIYNGRFEYIIAFMGSLIWLFIISKYIAPRIIRFKAANTIGDIFANSYGENVGKAVGILSVLFCMGHFTTQVVGASIILNKFFDINLYIAIFINMSIVVIYTSYGGITSVVKTDIFQLLMMFLGFGGLCFYLNFTYNDNVGIINYVSNNITIGPKFAGNSFFLTLTFIVMTFYPTFIQRLLLTKNEKIIKNALYQTIIGYIIFIAIISYIAIKVKIISGETENLKPFEYLFGVVPIGLKGLLAVALIASLASTADSDLNSAVTSFYKNIIIPKSVLNQTDEFKGEGAQRILIREHSRDLQNSSVSFKNENGISDHKFSFKLVVFLNIFLSLGFMLIAIRFKNLLDYIIFISGFWSSIILAPFMGIIFNIIIPKRALIFNSLLSIMSFYLWEKFYTNSYYKIHGVLVSTLVSLIAFGVAVALQKLLLNRSKV